MKKIIPFLSFFLAYSLLFAQKKEKDAILANYDKAYTILQKSIKKYGGKEKLNASLSFSLEGTLYWFGHYDTPEKSYAAKDTEMVAFHPSLNMVQSFKVADYFGRPRQSATLITQDSSYHYGFFARGIEKDKAAQFILIYLKKP